MSIRVTVAEDSLLAREGIGKLVGMQPDVEIVAMQGRTNTAVGAALGLSEQAVEKHISSVFSKLGLSEEPDTHRRVKAVLLYLSETEVPEGAGPTPAGKARTLGRRAPGCDDDGVLT